MKPISARSAVLGLCLLVSFLPACGSSRTQQTPATTFSLDSETLIKTELIFGLSMPNGEISQNELKQLKHEVAEHPEEHGAFSNLTRRKEPEYAS